MENKFKNHSDMMCIAYNYLFMEYENDRSKFFAKEDRFTVDFAKMEETINGQTRKIQRLDHDHVRVRGKDSERIRSIFDEG